MNQRQVTILREFYENENKFLTASHFSKQLGMSLRTIQTDLKVIKEELAKTNLAILDSVTPKGTRFIVIDKNGFAEFINANYSNTTVQQIDTPINRINQLICYLIEQFFAVKKTTLEDKFYISRSTLTNDLKKVAEILQNYNLRVVTKNNRLSVLGTEINKRNYLAKNDYYISLFHTDNAYGDTQRTNYFKRILQEEFTIDNYQIDDEDFKNTILMLHIIIKRMENGFFINPKELDIFAINPRDYKIAERIFKRIENHYMVTIPKEEIQFFSIYLSAAGTYTSKQDISDDLRKEIKTILKKVNEKYELDFSDNEELINQLALHCIPLMSRVKYNMQIENKNGAMIRDTFPLGFNMATYFVHKFARKYNKVINEDEIGYITVHLENALFEYKAQYEKKNVLVITSLKQSMILIMKKNIEDRFYDRIDQLDFKYPTTVTEEDYEKYDIVLSTQKDDKKDDVLYVNKILSKNDFTSLNLALDGFNTIQEVQKLFKEDLFFTSDALSKIDVLNDIVKQCDLKYGIPALNKAVQRREQVGRTYFGNGIVIAQPMQPVCDETFISVCYLETPIAWDNDDQLVNLVLLVHVGKNSRMLIPVWYILAYLIKDETTIEKLAVSPTYHTFISSIKNLITSN